MGGSAVAVPAAGVLLSSPGSKPMPRFGMGAAAWPLVGGGDVKKAVLVAIKLGYRHFDTATIYQTESSLGEAFAEALRLGLVKSRDELFVTTKLWCSDAHPDCVEAALRKSLQDLHLDYLDLYLIHWPVSSKPGKWEYPIKEDELLPLDMEGVWKAMEHCHRLGLARAIGVSNFSCSKLEKLLSFAEIPPAVNQVEMNPVWQQKQLRELCARRGVHLTGYSPLGAKGTPWGSGRVMDSPVLKEIAEAKGKSLAQVCLRWVYEQGVTVLVKSFNERRLEENLDIFDWELDEEDHRKIGQIPQMRGCRGEEFMSSTGPFKSTTELWDGET